MKIRLFIYIFLCVTNLFAFEIYEDKTNTIEASQIQNYNDKFITTEKSSFGITKSTIWLKINLKNDLQKDTLKYILFNTHLIENMDSYYFSNNKMTHFKSGLSTPINSRQSQFKEFVFEIPLKPKSTQTVYIKMNTTHIMEFSHEIIDKHSDLEKTLLLKNGISISAFSIVFTMLLIICIIAFWTREKIYYLYATFLISIFLMQLFMSGTMQYFGIIENYNMYLRLCGNIASIFVYLFLYNILKLKGYSKLLDMFLILMITSLIIFSILDIFQLTDFGLLRQKLYTLYIFSFLLITVFAMFKKLQFSTFLFVGWSFFIISAFMVNLHYLGVINNSFYTLTFQFGSVIEIITFSIMLLYRAKIINEERLAQEALLHKQETLIHNQSKFVTIGETLSNIEHQWRSPLSKVSSILMELQSYLRFKGTPTKEHLEKSINEANEVLLYMTDLVHDFKNFYVQDREKSEFIIKSSIDSMLKLLNHQLEKNEIIVSIDLEDELKTVGYPNEFTQVLINIISNSKDILIEREIKKSIINITAKKENDKMVLLIEDNAGGIKETNLDVIFEQSYSNKKEHSSGSGLYIAKNIIEKRMNGSIEVYNSQYGAVFKIVI